MYELTGPRSLLQFYLGIATPITGQGSASHGDVNRVAKESLVLHGLQDARRGNCHGIWKENIIPVIIFYKHFLGGELSGTTRKCKIKRQRPC